MDATVAADTFSIVSLWNNADWVIKAVMVGLALASLWSWAVIIDKIFRFTTLNAAANKFEDKVGSGRPLEEIAAESGADAKHPLPRLLNAALREWRDARAKGALGDTQTALLIQRIDRVLDSNIARESQKVEDGLGSLAIVATASPFIGLFGTVWGIKHSFEQIAISQNTNLAVVAPGIAEALLATGIGLVAAIPAVVFYNKLNADSERIVGGYESFADEFATILSRQLDS